MLKSHGVSRSLRVGAIVLLWVSLVTSRALPADKYTVTNHMVPMSDGVRLATDVFIPIEGSAPFPVIFSRGPYGKSGIRAGLATAACGRGYVLVAQDMRGTFDSEGSNAVVFRNDGWS